MHPYGHTRYASLSCKYGCCGTVHGVGCLKGMKVARKAQDRAARKRARQDGKREANTDNW